MEQGTLIKSLASVRKEPSETSEMVNQLLFGETLEILEKFKNWYRITSTFDQYPGWIDSRSIVPTNNINIDSKIINASIVKVKQKNDPFSFIICPGSELPNFNNGIFRINKEDFECLGNPLIQLPASINDRIIEVAKQFINAPYLWGGRSPFGIDCSGLTQVVFKICGISLPRDAKQQAAIGTDVEFVNQVQPGDLAFFDNDENEIIHVGILTGNQTIIHSSGYVRIDKFDHQGIFDLQKKDYSHKLRIIKRII
ncbi:MAG: C40 family peptidase [Bacteroidales bacterium]|nr:C40 family peptidase [Bacteroidales bacterium]HPD95682.1 NlpC/P60 family protein [Tenuifilaceae bacterium]HRX32097.1 NlpC/P60 family protein [Tenuifilaceae bacterium]